MSLPTKQKLTSTDIEKRPLGAAKGKGGGEG